MLLYLNHGFFMTSKHTVSEGYIKTRHVPMQVLCPFIIYQHSLDWYYVILSQHSYADGASALGNHPYQSDVHKCQYNKIVKPTVHKHGTVTPLHPQNWD